MRLPIFTTLSILFSLLLLTASAEQCGSQAGGAICASGLCCSKFGWCGNTDTYCGPGNCQNQCPSGPSPKLPTTDPGPLGEQLGSIISKSMFDQMLKHRNNNVCQGKNNFYSYNAFITAARSYPGFGTTGDITTRKREISAFFAQTSHETTGRWPTAPDGPYAWGYCFLREGNSPGDYCIQSSQWPCVPGKKYFGRGPIQLTSNLNYGPFGHTINEDLLNKPYLVATNPVISFKSAIWFWMTPQYPKPSCHNVIIGSWQPSGADQAANRIPGFGVITNIINGGVECGHGNDDRFQDRIGFYRRYCGMFGVSPGDNLDCGNQMHF